MRSCRSGCARRSVWMNRSHRSNAREDMIALGSGRIINIKPGRVGGFTSSLRDSRRAQTHGIPVWCGGMLESGIGRAYNVALASLPNFTLPGDLSPSARYWERDVVTPEWTMSCGWVVHVPLDVGRNRRAGRSLTGSRISQFEVGSDMTASLPVRAASAPCSAAFLQSEFAAPLGDIASPHWLRIAAHHELRLCSALKSCALRCATCCGMADTSRPDAASRHPSISCAPRKKAASLHQCSRWMCAMWFRCTVAFRSAWSTWTSRPQPFRIAIAPAGTSYVFNAVRPGDRCGRIGLPVRC